MPATQSLTPSAETTSHHQDVLNDFVDFGHRLTRLVVVQAEAATIPALKAASAYDCVTRSVRRSIWLIHKLAEPAPANNRVAARKQIIRSVEDAIQRHPDEDEAETLTEELWDRLDSLDLEDDIGNRPVKDIIQDIVHDLGLVATLGINPWKRRTPEDITELNARAAQPTQHPAAAPHAQPQTPAAWPNQNHHHPVGCNSS